MDWCGGLGLHFLVYTLFCMSIGRLATLILLLGKISSPSYPRFYQKHLDFCVLVFFVLAVFSKKISFLTHNWLVSDEFL